MSLTLPMHPVIRPSLYPYPPPLPPRTRTLVWSIAGAGVGGTPRGTSSACEQRDKGPTLMYQYLSPVARDTHCTPPLPPKSKPLRAPGSTNRHTHSALMASPPPPPTHTRLCEALRALVWGGHREAEVEGQGPHSHIPVLVLSGGANPPAHPAAHNLGNYCGTGGIVPFCPCGSLMAKGTYAFGAHLGLRHAS